MARRHAAPFPGKARADRWTSELPRIAAALEEIRARLLVRPLLIANATAAGGCFRRDRTGRGCPCRRALPVRARAARCSRDAARAAERAGAACSAESLVASASVGYVARAVPGFRYEHPLNGPVAVLGHLPFHGVSLGKGAHGGRRIRRVLLSAQHGRAVPVRSYRDPHITRTLRAFDDGLALMEKGELRRREVEKAVIGTIGREDRPIDPGEKGFVSLQRKLHGITDEARQARRDLAARRGQARDLAGRAPCCAKASTAASRP